jgi:hypothetical protein
MNKIQVKNIEDADETRNLTKTKIEVVNIEDITLMRVTFQPGWKWSQCIKPTVGTDSCQVPHINYILSGQIKIIMDDGTEKNLGPGDIAVIEPGHDAQVIGQEPCVALDFLGGKMYGKR